MTDDLTTATSNLNLEPKRRPYFGSCHCGKIRYIAYITLPMTPPYTWTDKSKGPPQIIRKCNCTVCHKFGYFHLRVADPVNDFMVLAPLDPLKDLSNYQLRPEGMNLLFCPTCGVRCFHIEGPQGKDVGVVVERDIAAEGIDLAKAKVKGDGTKVKVWVPNPDGWKEEEENWLRINATSLDAEQEGLDLREWTEKKWIQYVNWLDEVDGARSYEKPFRCGAY
jgi:hypothetical protein